MTANVIVDVLNLVGIAAFSLSGGVVGVRQGFDIVGVIALAIATALGGGLIRDVLINVRPACLLDPSWLLVAVGAAVVTLVLTPLVERSMKVTEVLDAVGLGLFSATSTVIALTHGVEPESAVLLGTIGGVGGGVVRDVLAGTSPELFSPKSRLYAVPAALGASVLVVIHHFIAVTGFDQAGAAAGICALRLIALWRGWTAPIPRSRLSLRPPKTSSPN